MKVLNLRCHHQHDFEGWFASEDAYQTQRSQGLVECPFCGDSQINKMLSAPRLNLLGKYGSGMQETAPETTEQVVSQAQTAVSLSAMPADVRAAWLKMVQHVMTNTEDVGTQFAEEARKMHYGEAQERGIRGHVSPQETQALLEEGIGVLPFPLPAALKGSVH